jgi:hypothetical protein
MTKSIAECLDHGLVTILKFDERAQIKVNRFA